jgi:hypothetical protein
VDDEAGTEPYECAFCGTGTSDDPRWIHISLEWEHGAALQQIGAHFACLRAALRPGFPLYDGLEGPASTQVIATLPAAEECAV